MANPRSRQDMAGFSLVELMVALLFTLILMAGMTAVFKSTLTSFSTAGEKLSSSRRNRMSLDMVYDDLNNAGMFLQDLSSPPSFSAASEGFSIVPATYLKDATDTTITFTDMKGNAVPVVEDGADQLLFYMDEPLPFEGELTATAARTGGELASLGISAATTDFTYTIDCKDESYAKQVAAGQEIIFKDSYGPPPRIASVTRTGSSVTLVVGTTANASITGKGYSGTASNFEHFVRGTNPGTSIVFLKPDQMVRYRIALLNLDPASSSATTPCLVREQGDYTTTGFPTTSTQQIVTENVVGFRAFLSADAGRNWVGGSGYADWAAIKNGISSQLANSGRTGYTSLSSSDLSWFRSTPVLVRIDVTTRTAVKREEYSLAYKKQVQSVVMVPRHFGLSMN